MLFSSMLLILVSHILKFVSLSTRPNCSWRQQLFFYTYLVIRRSFDFQNRDESRKSLREGLPVVSISIADSADFLYGDERDIAKADNVVWNQEICWYSEVVRLIYFTAWHRSYRTQLQRVCWKQLAFVPAALILPSDSID